MPNAFTHTPLFNLRSHNLERTHFSPVGVIIGNIRDAVKNGTPDGKEHPGLFNKKGHIGFLGHGSPVKFRNIRIKELK